MALREEWAPVALPQIWPVQLLEEACRMTGKGITETLVHGLEIDSSMSDKMYYVYSSVPQTV